MRISWKKLRRESNRVKEHQAEVLAYKLFLQLTSGKPAHDGDNSHSLS